MTVFGCNLEIQQNSVNLMSIFQVYNDQIEKWSFFHNVIKYQHYYRQL